MKKKKNIDAVYMRKALTLARKGAGRVSPNPMVGCVIVSDGKVVGRGFHEYFGGPHAEINALAMAGEAARNATMYITLEPCDHWGKTPPCTGAIIKAGIRRVVAAIPDPNPRTAEKGFKKLASHGIIADQGILEKEAEQLNRQYASSFGDPRTHVVVKAAMSLDGKIASRTGDSKWITGEKARKYVHRLRSRMDGILVGINTVIKDDPALTSHGQGKNPVRIIIDPGLRIPLKSKVLDSSAPTVIFHAALKAKAKLEELRKKRILLIEMPARKKDINFKQVVKKLDKMSIYKILIEGGGETVSRALKAGVVDEVMFFISPKIIGGREAKTPVEGRGVSRVADALSLKDCKVIFFGRDILVTGKTS
ncbi:MAG: bifunctional diaminohydroxyphosphoribosylaminopyrimidine deaminase/5-amino-6-(5-phosphoribosylamino)uracil reductase RibD [Endomicrobiales bacterium]